MRIWFLLFSAAILSFQARPRTLYDRPLDDAYVLRVVATARGSTLVRVLLVDRTNGDRFWELARVTEPFELNFKVERADRASVVLSRTTEYGIEQGFIKLFIDTPSKRLLKRIDFQAHENLKSVSDEEARRVGLNAQLLAKMKDIKLYASFDDPMNEDALNRSLRKFLETVSATSQREIEKAVRDAIESGKLKGSETLPAKAVVTLGGTDLNLAVDGEIELE